MSLFSVGERGNPYSMKCTRLSEISNEEGNMKKFKEKYLAADNFIFMFLEIAVPMIL